MFGNASQIPHPPYYNNRKIAIFTAFYQSNSTEPTPHIWFNPPARYLHIVVELEKMSKRKMKKNTRYTP